MSNIPQRIDMCATLGWQLVHHFSSSSSSSSTSVGSMPVGVWRHSYYRCPPLPI